MKNSTPEHYQGDPIASIQLAMPGLSATDRRIAEYILRHPQEIPQVTVYELADILPGKYTIEVFANSEPYRSRTVKNVRVAPDSASIVDIELGSEFIPEKLPPIEWKENIIRNGNKRRIY